METAYWDGGGQVVYRYLWKWFIQHLNDCLQSPLEIPLRTWNSRLPPLQLSVRLHIILNTLQCSSVCFHASRGILNGDFPMGTLHGESSTKLSVHTPMGTPFPCKQVFPRYSRNFHGFWVSLTEPMRSSPECESTYMQFGDSQCCFRLLWGLPQNI